MAKSRTDYLARSVVKVARLSRGLSVLMYVAAPSSNAMQTSIVS